MADAGLQPSSLRALTQVLMAGPPAERSCAHDARAALGVDEFAAAKSL
jgi:hypothetical protein